MIGSRMLRPSLVAPAGLVAGFVAARRTGRRELGGAFFGLAGVWSARRWWRAAGPGRAMGLAGLYAAAMGGSHPLAKKIGAWPSVVAVSAAVAVAAELGGRRGASPDAPAS